MIISVNWLKKYTDIDMPIDELASLIYRRKIQRRDYCVSCRVRAN
jgi:hypothetical protein